MTRVNIRKTRVFTCIVLFILFTVYSCTRSNTHKNTSESSAKKNDTANPLPAEQMFESAVLPREKNMPSSPQGSPDNPIILVTSEYMPYTSNNSEGFFTEITAMILRNAGLHFIIQNYPWDRCSDMIKAGDAWASFPYTPTEKRLEDFNMSDAVVTTRFRFIYLKDNPKIPEEVHTYSRIIDFKNLTFGGMNGYWFGGPEKFIGADIEVEWAASPEALMKMLLAGRIDFFTEDEKACRYMIETSFPFSADLIAFSDSAAWHSVYSLIVSRTYPDTGKLLQIFNDELARTKQSQKYRDILEKYGTDGRASTGENQ